MISIFIHDFINMELTNPLKNNQHKHASTLHHSLFFAIAFNDILWKSLQVSNLTFYNYTNMLFSTINALKRILHSRHLNFIIDSPFVTWIDNIVLQTRQKLVYIL